MANSFGQLLPFNKIIILWIHTFIDTGLNAQGEFTFVVLFLFVWQVLNS